MTYAAEISPRLTAGSVIDWNHAPTLPDRALITGNHGTAIAKTKQQDDRGDERREREAEQRRDPHRVVDEAVAVDRRIDAGGNAERDAEQQRDDGELDRPRQHAQHFADHRLTGDHRDAPVAAQRARQEHDVLLRDRQVETEAVPQRLDRLAARLVAEDQLRRIAGDDPHQHEDERQHREQRDAGEGEAANQERGHGTRSDWRDRRRDRPQSITFADRALTW